MNLIDKLEKVILNEKAIDTLNFLVNERLNKFDSSCFCENCKEFKEVLSNSDIKLNEGCYTIPISNYYLSTSYYFRDEEELDEENEVNEVAIKIDDFFNNNVINLFTDMDDKVYFCDKCFSFFKKKHISRFINPQISSEQESHDYFLIEIINNKNDVFNILKYVYIYKLLENFSSDIYKKLNFDDNVYVYSFEEYLSYKEEILSEEELLYRSIIGVGEVNPSLGPLHFDIDSVSIKSILASMGVVDFGFGLCRFLVNENDLVIELDETKLNEYTTFNIFEKNVKSFEFYDIVNDKWVNVNDCDLDALEYNNKKELIKIYDKKSLAYYDFYNESLINLYERLISFYNLNIENIIKKGE